MTVTFDSLVNEVIQSLHGYGLDQPRATFLTAAVDADDLTFQVRDASNFSQGIAEIGTETVFVETKDDSTNALIISPDGRGYYGTTAASHAQNTRIEFAPTWPRTQIAAAINEAIIGTYPSLFAVGTDTFTFNPSINTYEVPADAERILSITCDSIGPSREQYIINRYSFNSNAPTSSFPSGNTVTLERGPFPGRTVTVTYAKAPTEITYGDTFTESGLRDSARTAVKYAACSQLVAYMDTARLPVDSANADDLDPSKYGLGTASRLSVQLYQRYQIELERERKRLRDAHPVPLTVRTR